MTILRQFARKLAESVNASEREIVTRKRNSSTEMRYFLRFARDLSSARSLLHM